MLQSARYKNVKTNRPTRVFPYGIKEGGKETWLERTNTSNDLIFKHDINIFI